MAYKFIVDTHRVTSPVRQHLEKNHGVECISLQDVVSKYASAGYSPDMKKIVKNFSLSEAFLSRFPTWFKSQKTLFEKITKQSLFKHIPALAPIIKACDLCLQSEPIALIMLWNDVAPLTKSLTFLGKKYGIPTLHVSHGVHGNVQVHKKIWADKMAVYGERCKQLFLSNGNTEEKIVVTGNPYWDDRQPCKPNELNALKKYLGLSQHNKILLYAPTWYHNFLTNEDPLLYEKRDLSVLLETVRGLDKPEQIELIIKVHPGMEKKKSLYEQALRKMNMPGKIFTDISPLPLLQVADAVICSGGMEYEAALLGKIVLAYLLNHSSGHLYYKSPEPEKMYLRDHISDHRIIAPEDLSVALRKVLAGKNEITIERQGAFLRNITGPCDGKATERVANLALEMAKNRSSKPFISPVNYQKPSDTYYESARKDLPSMISGRPEKMLEIGCASGAMGHFIKQEYECEYIGIEINADVARMAEGRLDRVIVADVEKIDLEDHDIAEKSFDYIILGDVLEHLYDPWTMLYKCGRFLKDDGYILASIPNVRNFQIIDRLVKGFFTYKDEGILDSTHVRFFTLHEIKNMFANAGFGIEQVVQLRGNIGVDLNTLGEKSNLSSENMVLKNLSKEEVAELSTIQFCIKAGKESFVESKKTLPETNDKKASIIIVTYNSLKHIQPCIQSIKNNTGVSHEIIIVDNNSTDGTRQYLKTLEHATVILNDENKGFSYATNQGIKVSTEQYVILLNPDTLVTRDWAQRMVSHFKAGVGAVGPVSNYVAGLQKYEFHSKEPITGEIQINDLAEKLYQWNKGKGVETKLLIGFCLMIKKDVIENIGMLDEDLFLGSDDLEYSWRLRNNGYRLVVATDTFVYHKGQSSFKSEPEQKMTQFTQESQDVLYTKLEAHYGKGNVPSSSELWGMDWFKPRALVEASLKSTSIVILTHNQLEYTKKCIESIFTHTKEPFELIVVDNGSTDGTVEYLEREVGGRKNEDGGRKTEDGGRKAEDGGQEGQDGRMSTNHQMIELSNQRGGIESPEKLYQTARGFMEGGREKEAIGALRVFLGLCPDYALAHNDLGVLYFKEGEKEKAHKHYERASQLEPDNLAFQKNLADF